MSIRVMSRVWEDAPYGEGSLLLLLAIADFADDNGYAFPKVTSLAKKIRMSRTHTLALLKVLEADGVLRIAHGRGRGRGSQYWIAQSFIGKGQRIRPFAKRSERRQEKVGTEGEKVGTDAITPDNEPSLRTIRNRQQARSKNTGATRVLALVTDTARSMRMPA